MARLPTAKLPLTRAALPLAESRADKVVDPRYLTPEHRAWRAKVLRNAGFKCEGCRATGVRLYADHISELSDGGAALDPRNGQALCARCHQLKTAAARRTRYL